MAAGRYYIELPGGFYLIPDNWLFAEKSSADSMIFAYLLNDYV